MDIDYLKSDEIAVECQLRLIPPDSLQKLDLLKNALQAEEDRSQATPQEMHSTAKKQPERELSICLDKLQQHKQKFLGLEQMSVAEQMPAAQGLLSRLLHVQGRLQRARTSPTYSEKAQTLLTSCQQLTSTVEKFLSDSSVLNQSLDTAKLLVLESVEPSSALAGSDSAEGPEKPEMPKDPPASQDQTAIINTLMNQLALLSQQVTTLQSQSAAAALPPHVSQNVYAPFPTQNVVATCYPAQVQFHNPPVTVTARIPQSLPVYQTPDMGHVPIGRSSLEPLTQINHNNFLPASSGVSNITSSSPINHPPVVGYVPIGRSSLEQTPYVNPANFPPISHAPQAPNFYSNNTTSVSDRRAFAHCGISYNGSPAGITVDMFLFQLDSVITSFKISADILLSDLHLLLKDVALQWYWTYRRHNPSASWIDLRREFLERFKDRRSPYEIRRMVESRKQLPTENFLDYYHHMWNLSLQCHSPYSDGEFIQLLINNMKPALQYHLTDRHFSHINDLIKSCTAWEDTLKRFRTQPDYSSYPRRGVSELSTNWRDDGGLSVSSDQIDPADELIDSSVSAFRGPMRNPVVIAKPDKPLNVNLSSVVSNAAEVGNCPVCFNCSDLGHTFQNCPLPPIGYFCYRCGRKDTIASRCPRCSGNRNSGPWRSGNNGPQRISSPKPRLENVASNTDPELWRSSPGGKKPTSP